MAQSNLIHRYHIGGSKQRRFGRRLPLYSQKNRMEDSNATESSAARNGRM
jgi:hypothetical protein